MWGIDKANKNNRWWFQVGFWQGSFKFDVGWSWIRLSADALPVAQHKCKHNGEVMGICDASGCHITF